MEVEGKTENDAPLRFSTAAKNKKTTKKARNSAGSNSKLIYSSIKVEFNFTVFFYEFMVSLML